jgi:putative membrane protein
MNPAESDPRVLFAAERTLLAWIRTALGVMGLGFVIAKFGLFVHIMSLQLPSEHAHPVSGLSAVLGIFFVLTGAIVTWIATIQHRRFVASLSDSDIPTGYSTTFASGFGVFMGLLGIVLAGYLVISQA